MSEIYISKVHCQNFRAFRDRQIDGLTSGVNILVGDNDTGKSTILLALDLVLRTSITNVQNYGLESLLNRDAVADFLLKAERVFADLPVLEIDLYLEGLKHHEYEGPYNLLRKESYGVCLVCRPRDDLHDEIVEIIKQKDCAFPFEYYSIEFKMFSGAPLTHFKRPLQHLNIDNTKISNDYASRAYVRDVYRANTEETEKSLHQIKYRQAKLDFASSQFETLNKKLEPGTTFAVKSNSRENLESDLTIKFRDIDIENLGMGMQCFIRTSFALSKKSSIDVVLLEEPENHLSQINMKKLIDQIAGVSKSQVFIATHSSYICSRLDLRKAILFGSPKEKPLRLTDIPEDTAEFFMKAPHNSLLDFIQAPKSILVEGDAEYMLIAPLYEATTGTKIEAGDVTVISVGGISFPRYLDVAKLLRNRVAVITDNDGDPGSSRLERYRGYATEGNIAVFCDPDPTRATLEICVYQDNRALCDSIFGPGRRTQTVEQYMLNNKSDAAFQLTKQTSSSLVSPSYIKDAITWIRS